MATHTRVISEEEVISHDNDSSVASFFASYQILYLLLTIVTGSLFLRFVFRMFGANQGAGFTQFLYNTTDVLMVPFRFIFPTTVESGAVFEWSVIVAMIVYTILFSILVKILSIIFASDQIVS